MSPLHKRWVYLITDDYYKETVAFSSPSRVLWYVKRLCPHVKNLRMVERPESRTFSLFNWNSPIWYWHNLQMIEMDVIPKGWED